VRRPTKKSSQTMSICRTIYQFRSKQDDIYSTVAYSGRGFYDAASILQRENGSACVRARTGDRHGDFRKMGRHQNQCEQKNTRVYRKKGATVPHENEKNESRYIFKGTHREGVPSE
jgi:hypothetical protein